MAPVMQATPRNGSSRRASNVVPLCVGPLQFALCLAVRFDAPDRGGQTQLCVIGEMLLELELVTTSREQRRSPGPGHSWHERVQGLMGSLGQSTATPLTPLRQTRE